MAKGRGGGVTPPRIVELLKKAVAEKSQSAVARESGLTLLTVQRYLKGIGEPTGETLRKLEEYFEVPFWWLSGVDAGGLDMSAEEAHAAFSAYSGKSGSYFSCSMLYSSGGSMEHKRMAGGDLTLRRFGFLSRLIQVLDEMPDDIYEDMEALLNKVIVKNSPDT